MTRTARSQPAAGRLHGHDLPSPGEDSRTAQSSPRHRLLYPGAFIAYADRFAIPPVLLAISRDFGVSLGSTAMIASLYFLLYGGMQAAYGILADRIGRVRVIRLAALGMGIANLAAAAAPTMATLAAFKGAAGGFAAAIYPITMVYVGDTVPFARRQQVIASILAAGAVGTTLATAGAGVLARFAGWRVVFLIPAVLGLALAAALGRLPESLPALPDGSPRRQLSRVFRDPWARFLLALAVFEGAAMLGFLTFLAPALEAQGESSAVAGSVVAAYGVAVFVGMQFVRHAARRAPAAAMIAAGGAVLTVAYLVAAEGQQVFEILAASVLVGVAFGFLHSTLQTWATEVVPGARGTATTLFVTCVFLGAAIATTAVADLAGAGRYAHLFLIAAAVSVPVTVAASVGRARFQRAIATRG